MITTNAAMPSPRGPHPWRNARFDPRAVLAGIVLLFLVSVSGYIWGDQAARKADEVAAPVAQLCQQGGATGAKLRDSGACGAAGEVVQGTGPFRSDIVGLRGVAGSPGGVGTPGRPGADSTVPGSPGKAGEPGADSTIPGADGQPGANGTDGLPGLDGTDGDAGVDGLPGLDGANGVDGAPGAPGPPGADGKDGQDGATGPPGPTCPDGTSLQPVVFSTPDGDRNGLGCVSDAPVQEGGS